MRFLNVCCYNENTKNLGSNFLINDFSTKPGSIETNPTLVVEVSNVKWISIYCILNYMAYRCDVRSVEFM